MPTKDEILRAPSFINTIVAVLLEWCFRPVRARRPDAGRIINRCPIAATFSPSRDSAHRERAANSMSGAAGIGVVVVSHNSADDLGACLGALTGADDIDSVVVVDNASSDGSRDVVLGLKDPRIKLVAEEINTGFAGGCNRGFRELGDRHDVLAFLNPDVEVSPTGLSKCAGEIRSDERLAGLAPRLMRSDGLTVDSVGQVLNGLTLEVKDRGYGAELSPELMTGQRVLAPCGALAVFRQTALEEVADDHGPWAQHFFCFWEDLEIGWRLVNRGWEIHAFPDAVATHGRGAGAIEGSGPLRWRRPPELEACILSNRWMTLLRHLHTLDLAPRLPLLLGWDSALVALGGLQRPALIGHLRRRWPMVVREWKQRRRYSRRRLHELL